jgi:hypothetical protein
VRARGLLAALATLGAHAACNSPERGTPRAEQEASSVAATDGSPVTPPARSAAADASPGRATTFSGTYKSAPSALYLPPELKVRWRPEETDAGVGEGELSLAVEPEGRVHGAVEGPLGPAVVEGYAREGALTAKVSRKDPADHGFAGTLSATQTPGRIEGTMNLSLAAGGALRSATFVLVAGDAGASP